jgi:hypothetical protein
VYIQTALDNASAIRVCQPGPVAFQRANVSGGNRIEIDVRALPDFGRPRGFNILAADAAPKISGSTSRALRARAKVSFVHAGFSRSAFWGLGLRFISFHLAFVGLVQTDHMRLVGARRIRIYRIANALLAPAFNDQQRQPNSTGELVVSANLGQ